MLGAVWGGLPRKFWRWHSPTCCSRKEAPAGIGGTGEGVGVSGEIKPGLLQGCAVLQCNSCWSLQLLCTVGGGNHLQSKSPPSKPQRIPCQALRCPHRCAHLTPGDCSGCRHPWQGGAGSAHSFSLRMRRSSWDTASPWVSRQLLSTGILTCDLAGCGSLPTSL